MPWQSDRIFDYPIPIVDETIARKHAAKQQYDLRKVNGYDDLTKGIIKKHASRKKIKTKNKTKPVKPKQFCFCFDQDQNEKR